MSSRGEKRKKRSSKDKKHKHKRSKRKRSETDQTASLPAEVPNSVSRKSSRAGLVEPATSIPDSVKQWRKENDVDPVGPAAFYLPYTSFDDAPFPKPIRKFLKAQGFETPTPIQAQAWPIGLAGRDIVGIAETGSGKTLSFSLPILTLLEKGGIPEDTVSVLVVSPTRELAQQTNKVMMEAGSFLDMRSVCVYGGEPIYVQIKKLKKPPTIIVATPGRLIDLVNRGEINLEHVKYMVLDEADRMLDQGFEPEIRKIFGFMNVKKLHTFMFSATWPEAIQELANRFLSDALKIRLGDGTLKACKRVVQHVEVFSEPRDRQKRLLQIMKKVKRTSNKVLVFVLYKKETDYIARLLDRQGYKAHALDGGKNQATRNSIISQFKQGRINLVVATDVAARGLDVDNIECVINYSFPLTIEEYVHRIGRTGRAGKDGVAYTFFTDHDKRLAGPLHNVLKENEQKIPQELFKYSFATKKKEKHFTGKIDINKRSAGHIVFEDSDSE